MQLYFCMVILQQLLQSDWPIIIKVEMTTHVVGNFCRILHDPFTINFLQLTWHGHDNFDLNVHTA